jgi:hypothetical protein
VSSCLAHFSNISYRLGKEAEPGVVQEAMKGQPAAAETLARLTEHLAANGVKLDATKATLGVPLTIDPATETVKDNPAATALLTRKYREPFVVKEVVA